MAAQATLRVLGTSRDATGSFAWMEKGGRNPRGLLSALATAVAPSLPGTAVPGRYRADARWSVGARTSLTNPRSGEGGIRTPGGKPHSGLANRRTRPLCDLSGCTAWIWRRERDSNPRCLRTVVFKTTTINHSDIPPCRWDTWRHHGSVPLPACQRPRRSTALIGSPGWFF